MEGCTMKRVSPFASLVIAAALVLVAGATAAPPPPRGAAQPGSHPPPPTVRRAQPQDAQRTIDVGGTTRHYLLHLPARDKRALPLVFVLHGSGGSAKGMVHLTDFDAQADEVGFYVAYLQGTGQPAAWNNGLTPELAPELAPSADDVAFVRAVHRQLGKAHQIDAHRVYAAGFSNGAFMSHRLAAEASDLLAAVAVVEGTVGIRDDAGTWRRTPRAHGPISVIMVHGMLDPNLPFDGGQGLHAFVLAVSDEVALWTKTDQCTGTPRPQTSVDGNVTTTDYASCTHGTEVELQAIADGKHEWPMRSGRAGYKATDAIWEFFSRHSR
jgi:polyhydroxybutyrate depolymerase